MTKLNKNFFLDILRSIFIALLASFALVLILAIFVKFFSMSERIIAPINIAIKTVCILLGALIGIREKSSGLLKGLLIGGLYILVSLLFFALLDGGFQNVKMTVFDVIIGLVVGVIAGVVKVNIK